MRQRDIPNVKNSTALLDSFEEFMKRKPVKMRNTYWRAFLASWVAAEEQPFVDAVACVFDNLKFAAANTSDKAWDDQLEDLAEDVIEFAPKYKKEWKDISKLCARIRELEDRLKESKPC